MRGAGRLGSGAQEDEEAGRRQDDETMVSCHCLGLGGWLVLGVELGCVPVVGRMEGTVLAKAKDEIEGEPCGACATSRAGEKRGGEGEGVT